MESDNYLALLAEVGIVVEKAEWEAENNVATIIEEEKKINKLPIIPAKYDEQGVACFTSSQISWALPSDFGFTDDYMVIEEEHYSHPLVTDYNDEKYLRKRPIHRYCLIERFKSTLCQLLGFTGDVPVKVLNLFDWFKMVDLPKEELWDYTRSILKKNKLRLYYNRIPIILRRLHLVEATNTPIQTYDSMMSCFKLMKKKFPIIKKKLGRSYFPNLRYVALRLMEQHEITPVCKIPLTRTLRKQKSLALIFDTLWEEIEKDFWSE